jgi:hypothetical protein
MEAWNSVHIQLRIPNLFIRFILENIETETKTMIDARQTAQRSIKIVGRFFGGKENP